MIEKNLGGNVYQIKNVSTQKVFIKACNGGMYAAL